MGEKKQERIFFYANCIKKMNFQQKISKKCSQL